MIVALLVASLAGIGARWRAWPVAPIALIAALLVLEPLGALAAAALAALAVAVGRVRSARIAARGAPGRRALAADVVALGLTAGLPIRAALETAARRCGPPISDEIGEVLRTADRTGLGPALADATGESGRMLRLAARASATGAPLAAAVTAYAAEERHAAHTSAVEAARRLPVRLLLPLALLVLPGFVVLVLGPVLVDSLARIGPFP